MNKPSFIALWCACVLMVLTPHTFAQSRAASGAIQNANRIVVLVNSEPITMADLRSRMARIQQNNDPADLPPLAELERQVLEQLIVERTQIQAGRDIGIEVDQAAVQEAEVSIARQNGVTLDQLHERVQQMGQTPSAFRTQLRNEIALQRVREREVDGRVRISEVDIDQYLRRHSAVGSPTETALNLAHLLITVPESATPAQIEVFQSHARDLALRARAGEAFSLLAAEFSEGVERNVGGEMGLTTADRYPPLFLQAVGSAERGAVVGPFRSGAGFHILLVLDKRNANLPDPFVMQTRARHVLLTPTAQRNETATAQQLKDVRQQIVRGQLTFEAAAQQYSQDGSAASGGDLGWAAPGQFVPEFESVMNNLALGELSQPTVSRFGVHLIQVVERRQVEMTTTQRRTWVRNVLREQKEEEAYEDWASDLRARAFVEFRDN